MTNEYFKIIVREREKEQRWERNIQYFFMLEIADKLGSLLTFNKTFIEVFFSVCTKMLVECFIPRFNVKNEDFNQRFGCAAPKHWSNKLSVQSSVSSKSK